jgi:putative transposase
VPEAARQRCDVHFRRNIGEARKDLAGWLERWQGKYPRLTDWAEERSEEAWTVYRLLLPHHKHLKSTNMLERFNEEIRRRTRVVRILPNPSCCLRLIRALAAETHESGLEESRYLHMELFKEQKKGYLHQLAAA